MVNSICLPNRENKRVALLKLYRVMSIGHLDQPNEQAKYKAVLRECIEGEKGIDSTVVVPEVYRPLVFEAFNKDLYVLARSNMNCIESIVMLQQPDFFDIEDYAAKNGYPQP